VQGWQLQGQGEPYQTYRLERTTDLAIWATISTVSDNPAAKMTAQEIAQRVQQAQQRSTSQPGASGVAPAAS